MSSPVHYTDPGLPAPSYLALHEGQVAYREYPGRGTPILLIHGVGSSAATWRDIPARLAASGKYAITIDLPGHGDSTEDITDYSIEAYASAVEHLLDHLLIARAHLVGHSLGGGVALRVADVHPERVETLTLVASGGLGEGASPLLRAATLPGTELAMKLAINRATLTGAAFVSRVLSSVGVAPYELSDSVLETVAGLAQAGHREAFIQTLRGAVNLHGQKMTALDTLPGMAGDNVLLVWNQNDPVVPTAHGHHAAEMLPGARLVIVPGHGHEPHAVDLQYFTDLVIEHVGARRRRGRTPIRARRARRVEGSTPARSM